MSGAQTFRPKSGWALLGSASLLAAFWLWAVVLTGSAIEIIATTCWALAALIGIYLVSVRPRIVFTDSHIEIVNPLQRARMSWSDVIQVGAKWALTVESTHGEFKAWAAPAPSRFHAKKISASELKSMRIAGEESIFAAHSPRSDSGIALHLAQIYLAGYQGGVSEFSARRQYGGLIAVLVCVGAAIALQLIN